MLANLYCLKWLEEKENELEGVTVGSYITCIGLPKNIIRFNGRIECDMLLGPCSCGSWHKKYEIVDANMEYINV